MSNDTDAVFDQACQASSSPEVMGQARESLGTRSAAMGTPQPRKTRRTTPSRLVAIAVAALALALACTGVTAALAGETTIDAGAKAILQAAGSITEPQDIVDTDANADDPVRAAVRAAIEAHEETVTVEVGADEANAAMYALTNDPTLFYLERSWTSTTHSTAAGEVIDTTVSLTYRYSADEAAAILAQCETVAQEILALVPAGTDPWHAALIVHDELCRRISYPGDDAIIGYEEDGTAIYPAVMHGIDGALLSGVAVCDGYVTSYIYLLGKLGIPCDAVAGDGHSRCVVQIDGQRYYVDVTWDDSDEVTASGVPTTQHLYFMFNDADLARMGGVVDQTKTPCAPVLGEAANYYVHEGYLLGAYDYNDLAWIWGEQIRSGATGLTVRFNNDEAYQGFLGMLQNNDDALWFILSDLGFGALSSYNYTYADDMRVIDLWPVY